MPISSNGSGPRRRRNAVQTVQGKRTHGTRDVGPSDLSERHRRNRFPNGDPGLLVRRTTPANVFASEMADMGLSSEDVGDVPGHTSKSITEAIYTHAFNREQREARIRRAMGEAMGG